MTEGDAQGRQEAAVSGAVGRLDGLIRARADEVTERWQVAFATGDDLTAALHADELAALLAFMRDLVDEAERAQAERFERNFVAWQRRLDQIDEEDRR